MKPIKEQYQGIAPCANKDCPAHTECLRFIKWKDEHFIWAGNFAPSSPHAQHCRNFKRVKR